jgi:hypothetical protein
MVKAAVACTNHLLITAVGTPRRCIPHVCRASCNRITGSPAAWASLELI